ncbi:MAG: hypothetical protein LAP85_18825 [Acidobacteriia bacterium]|nr:hypothetical protein [Terriglobia bacterium]
MLPAVLGLCLNAMPGIVRAQTAAAAQAPDLLRPLKIALGEAGVAALTSDQEAAIMALITDFRAQTAPVVSATRASYYNYILSGDATDAVVLLPALMSVENAQAQARAQARINFAAGVAAALTSAQMTALQAKFSDEQIVRFIEALAGGPGGMRGARGALGPASPTPFRR